MSFVGPTVFVIFHVQRSYFIYFVHTVAIICALCMVSASMWVHHVRNRHHKAIERRNRRFGVHGEELNLLKCLRKAVREILQLNAITATLIVIGGILRFIALLPTYRGMSAASSSVNITFGSIHFVYIVSNPIVYLFVMTDLRQEYGKHVRRFSNRMNIWNNRVHPQP